MIPKQCPVCNGSGKVMRGSFGDPLKEVSRDCHSCNASGFLKLDADDYKEAITTHLDGTGHTDLASMRREFDAMRAVLSPNLTQGGVWKELMVNTADLYAWTATRPKETTNG